MLCFSFRAIFTLGAVLTSLPAASAQQGDSGYPDASPAAQGGSSETILSAENGGEPVDELGELPPDAVDSIRRAWDDARFGIRAAGDEPSVGGLPTGFVALNPVNGVHTFFAADGVHIEPSATAGEPSWQWSLSLATTGYEDDPLAAEPVISTRVNANSLVMERGWLVESYRHSRSGLKQDFRLSVPPQRSDGAVERGWVELTLAISTGLDGQLAENLQTVTYHDPASGDLVLTVSGLLVTDAVGTHLASEFDVGSGELLLRFDDSRAEYPVLVDPLVTVNTTRKYGQWPAERGRQDFGRAVAVDGDTIAIGVPRAEATFTEGGRVYIFSRAAGWNPVQILDSDEDFADFGASIALQGDRMVVGAPEADNTVHGFVTDGGEAYVYERSGGIWSRTATLAADGVAPISDFGLSVALEGDTIAVGAPKYGSVSAVDDNGVGAVFVFQRSGANWPQLQRIDPPSPLPYIGFFGAEVVLEGAHLLTQGNTTGGGIAYFYRRTGTGPFSALTQFGGGALRNLYATGLALHGTRALVGGRLIANNAGIVDIFDYNGSSWTFTGVLGNVGSDDGYGSAIVLNGDRAVISAPNVGKVYARTYSGNTWTTEEELTAADEPLVSGYGWSLALDATGSFLLVGRSSDFRWKIPPFWDFIQGSVYAYERSGADWRWDVRLPYASAFSGDQLGAAIDAAGDLLAVGAPYYDGPPGADCGAVMLFRRSETGRWSCTDLFHGDGAGDRLGTSVALFGNLYLAAGAPGDIGGAGSVNVYRNSGGWSKIATLNNPAPYQSQAGADSGQALAFYSYQVAPVFIGDPITTTYSLVVGAPGLDISFANQGAAFLYTASSTAPSTWSYARTFTASDAAADDRFGTAVAAYGTSTAGGTHQIAQIAIGASGDDNTIAATTYTNAGSVYRFSLNTQLSGAWQTLSKLTPSQLGSNNSFGQALAYDGATLMAGAPGELSDQGAVYFLDFFSGSGTRVLSISPSASDAFGYRVDVDGDVAAAGAIYDGSTEGRLVLLSKVNGAWSSRSKNFVTDRQVGDYLGAAVALGPDYVAAGALLDDAASGSDQGSFYMFDIAVCAATDRTVTRTSAASICSGQSVTVTVAASEVGATYQLRQGVTPLGAAVAGTGGTIALSSPLTSPDTQTISLNVLATWNETGCAAQLTQTATVEVLGLSPPIASVDRIKVCEYDSGVITLTATGGAAGANATLNWYTGSCGATWIGSGSPLVVDSPTFNTIYYARWEGSCGASPCDSVSVKAEATGSVLYVRPGGTGTCGDSWADAFGDLQLALAAAAGSDGSVEQIWVAEGTYKPTSGSDRNATFTLLGDFEVYGGFSGSESSLSQRNLAFNPTILSGDLLGNDGPNFANNTENSYNVVSHVTAPGLPAVLDGFIIRGGNASAASPNNRGGGLDLAARAVIRNCTIESNSAAQGGGGARFSYDVEMENCVIQNNRVTGNYSGGGIRMEGGLLILENCRLFRNTAGVAGGGVVMTGGVTLAMFNCLVAGNTAGGPGGGIGLYGTAPAYVVNSTIYRNSAASQGGGIHVDAGTQRVILNSIVWDNTAPAAPAISNLVSIEVGRSIVQGGFPGVANLADDPQLWDADGDDNIAGTLDDFPAPVHCSPALDAGDAARFGYLSTDINGQPRVHDVPGQPNTGVGSVTYLDIGAYEPAWTNPVCPFLGDADGDGDIDVDDLLRVLGNFGCTGDCDGDLDQDGDVDVDDLLLVLGNFGN